MSATRPASLPVRVVRNVRRRGFASIREAVRMRVGRLLPFADVHVWYRIAPAADRPRRELAEGYTFRAAGPEDAEALAGLPTVSPDTGRARIAGGADLWLVEGPDGSPAFACWTFHTGSPVFAARGGELKLPEGVSCLEDSVTSADHRGKGIAPAAWTLVSDRMRDAGVRDLITTIEEENAPSRKAILKAGFSSFAVVRHEGRAGKRDVVLWGDGSPLADELRARLPAEPAQGPSPVELGAA